MMHANQTYGILLDKIVQLEELRKFKRVGNYIGFIFFIRFGENLPFCENFKSQAIISGLI